MSKIFFASDHAGFNLKQVLIEYVVTLGYDIEDLGARSLDPEDDYPDYTTPCAKRVAETPDSLGILLGGSGQGEAMSANRVPGARASVYYGSVDATDSLDIEGSNSKDTFDVVRLPRQHNDANILSIGARFVSESEALKAVRIFLETPFSGVERHTRRIAKF